MKMERKKVKKTSRGGGSSRTQNGNKSVVAMEPGIGNKKTEAMEISKKQGMLFLETMGILFFQVVVMVAVVLLLQNPKKYSLLLNGWFMFSIILVEFGFLFAILFSRDSVPWSMFFFTCFSILNGILMAPVYWFKENRKGVMLAIASTLAIFVIMVGYGIYAYQNGFTMIGWGRYLFIALIALLVGMLLQWGLVMSGVDVTPMNRILSVVGIVLFSMYIAYDTQLIFLGQRRSIGLKGKSALEQDNPVIFAVNLYIDLLNLFQFMQSSSR